ncbi:multidrug effflux MFS transporter [Gammaproteobacteria bacterium]|nr:multidrug effflux MFS transporter [Gammaproteobacteria bacterium]
MRDKLPLPLMAAIAALPPLAVDMYLPAIPGIAADLNTEISVIQNSLSIYLIGFGLGLLVFGPFSDRFGRRPLALFGLTGFAASSFFLSISTSAEVFLFFRLVQGFLGSAATVVIPAMIRDCYGKDTAKGLSTVTMIMLLAPLVAPLMGSFFLTLGEWEILFQALTAYGVVLFILTFLRLPETRPATSESAPRSFLSNYKIIMANHSIYFDLLCFMLSALTFFTYLTSVSFIYITYFQVSETLFGILFACTASALIFANFINVRVVSRFGPRKMMQAGLVVGTLFSGLLIIVSLSNLAVYWTVACFIFLIGSLGISSINADALILLEFPNQASSASAVTGTLRFGCGALAGPILAVIYNGTPVPIAIMMFVTMLGAGIAQILHVRQIKKKENLSAE